MSVHLALSDGTIREYPVVSRRKQGVFGTPRTSCGAPDCEHLDCAIDIALYEYGESRNYLFLGAILIIGIIALPVLMYTQNGSQDLVPGYVLPILAIVLLLSLMQAKNKVLGEQGTRIAELQEYKKQKTVAGMPARQVPSGRAE